MSESFDIYCSFCGKRKDEVSVMVAGPASIFICDECVQVCADSIAARHAKKTAETKANSTASDATTN